MIPAALQALLDEQASEPAVPEGVDSRYVLAAPFCRYDEQGNIVEWGQMQIGFLEEAIERGERVLALRGVVHANTHWVDPATRACYAKTEMPGRVDGLTIRNLPVPCTFQVEGQTYTCDDGKIELEFAFPGTYQVVVRSVPHLERVFEVIAE